MVSKMSATHRVLQTVRRDEAIRSIDLRTPNRQKGVIMSRTLKDRPWRLGGDRHKWVIVANHGAHGKFTTEMRRARRREEKQLLAGGEERMPRKSRWRYMYFD